MKWKRKEQKQLRGEWVLCNQKINMVISKEAHKQEWTWNEVIIQETKTGNDHDIDSARVSCGALTRHVEDAHLAQRHALVLTSDK